MPKVEAVCRQLERLTYAEMMELSRHLRDAWQTTGGDLNDSDQWAMVIHTAAENYTEQ